MNTERLLREVEKRLAQLPESHRSEVLDALREEISRAKRRVDKVGTVETERERRLEAETLREVLEAINRHTALDDTVGEILKQLSRLVVFDSCYLAVADADGLRILAVRGFPEPSKAVGSLVPERLASAIHNNQWPIAIGDVLEEEGYQAPPGCGSVRSCAGLPLMVEGQILGLLCLQRQLVDPFDEEDVHRAKTVAFSAAAAIRKAQLHDHVRRYANLMERVVAVDHAVFRHEAPEKLADVVLEGALRVAGRSAGLLVLEEAAGSRVAAVAGEGLESCLGRPAPPELLGAQPGRLAEDEAAAVTGALGLSPGPGKISLVPLATSTTRVGLLALFGRGPDSPAETLMEAFASRVATAYLHALGQP